VIIATGFAPFDPRLKPELGYHKYAGVVSTRDLERLLQEQPRALHGLRDIVFIQCVGSRDKQVGNPYCSRLCCMVSAKQAHLLVQRLPDARITVLYTDVRAYGKGFEELYDLVRSEGVRYRRGNASEVTRYGERLVVRAEDSLLRQPVELEADLVVLSVGLTPRADADSVSQLFKLARSDDGFFMERHPKLGPVETGVDGVYLAGACQSPKDITEAVAHAKAAASAALIPMLRHQVKVESAVSNAIPEMCAGCGLCAANCPYGALAVDTRLGAIRVNPALCKGCGACSNICPSNAIKVEHFRPEQILAQIDGLLFPG
jgi:heterodisulfide reductase subunit A